MLPWKTLVRSVSVVTLLTAGAFAAGQEVLPFNHVSRSTAPDVVLDEPPVAEDGAPDVEPADEAGDDTTTTTTEPAPAPTTEDPGTDSDGDSAAEVEAEEDPAPRPADARRKAKPETPASPAPSVSARPAPLDGCPGNTRGDHNHDGHCDNGWLNKDAEWRADKANRAETGPAATKAKGDHNCDGHPDNGWPTKERPACPAPAVTPDGPGPAEAAEQGEERERPDTAGAPAADRARNNR